MNNLTDKSLQNTRIVEIPPDCEGQRIDNFLFSLLKGVPKSHIYRILRKGEVRVNKGRVKADYRLNAGDLIRIPPIRLSEKKHTQPGSRVLELIDSRIIYEDKKLLVLDKPSGVAVHGGSGVSYGVIEAIRALRPDFPFFELVHRLDRETSGCLLIAKKRSTLRQLHELFRTDRVQKQYIALVKGSWKGGKRKVDLPLQKNVMRSGERMVQVTEEGKVAISYFEPIEYYKSATLMRVFLGTGRTHQIRVHAAHVGHPVAGDQKYGDAQFNQRMRGLGLGRLFLHAAYLGFTLTDDKEISVSAPLSDDLRQVLLKLQ
jgi:23S rRNA pseudouridine955/2504/2580 synthase